MDFRILANKLSEKKNFSMKVLKSELDVDIDKLELNNILNPSKELIEIFLMDSINVISLSNTDRLILLTKLAEGKIEIHEDDSTNWVVNITF